MREIAVVEARVERAVADLLERRARHLVVQLDLEQRKARGRLGQEIGETDELGIGERADADMAGDRAFHRAGLAVQRGGVGEDLGRLREQPLAGRRERHPGRAAFEQLHAELVLERLDLGAQRGLAQVQPLGGPGEMAGFGDGDKAA